MEYRVLSRAEIRKLDQMDRTERIDAVYRVRGGSLVLGSECWDVPDWSPSEKQQRIAALQEEYDKGATFFGAFLESVAEPTLVGMSVLDDNPMPGSVHRLNLSGLWVSRDHRGKGVGSTLSRLAVKAARERGAAAVYVSATPSENTVRFYRSLGFELTEQVDPDLFRDEPDDIHMELSLE